MHYAQRERMCEKGGSRVAFHWFLPFPHWEVYCLGYSNTLGTPFPHRVQNLENKRSNLGDYVVDL